MKYTITYSVGTTAHDEQRFVKRGVAEAAVPATISRLAAQGKRLYSVERETGFVA